MSDVTGGTPPTNASTFDAANDIADVYAHFGAQAQYSVANAAALPASGNWVGRHLMTEDTDAWYLCTALPGTWSKVTQPATVAGSTVTPTAGAGFTLSSNQLFVRNGWLMGTIVWNRTSGTLSHADVILTMPSGYGPLFDIPVGGSMGPSPFISGNTGLFRSATRDVQALSPEPGRTSGALSFAAPITL